MSCLAPIHKAGSPYYYPCGRCVVCRENLREEFAGRFFLESRCSACSFFVTLTYDDANLVYADGLPCFDKIRCKYFLRSLRDYLRYNYGVHLRYYFTCEYGDLTDRIHYHALMYLDKPMAVDVMTHIIEEHWPEGFSSIGTVTIESCMYVSKYCLKDDETDNLPPDSPFKPFRFFSRKPGIGATPACVKYASDKLRIELRQSSYEGITHVPRVIRGKLHWFLQNRLNDVGMSRFEDMQDKLKLRFHENHSGFVQMDDYTYVNRYGESRTIKFPHKNAEILEERKKRRILRKSNQNI